MHCRSPRSLWRRAAAALLAVGLSGCFSFGSGHRDVDRSPIVNTGVGATIPRHLHYQITSQRFPAEDLTDAATYPTRVRLLTSPSAAHAAAAAWIARDPEHHDVNLLVAPGPGGSRILLFPRDRRRSHAGNKGLIGSFETAGYFVYSEPGTQEVFAGADAATARAAQTSPIDQETWRGTVGGRIAQRTAPGRIQRRMLQVRVASAVWAQELSFLSDDIVARLRQAGFDIDSIRFSVGKLGTRPPSQKPPRPIREPARLPDQMRERLERIDDPELRAAIAEAAGQSLALADQAPTSKTPGARAPRSVGSRSAPPARNAPASRARARRKL